MKVLWPLILWAGNRISQCTPYNGKRKVQTFSINQEIEVRICTCRATSAVLRTICKCLIGLLLLHLQQIPYHRQPRYHCKNIGKNKSWIFRIPIYHSKNERALSILGWLVLSFWTPFLITKQIGFTRVSSSHWVYINLI